MISPTISLDIVSEIWITLCVGVCVCVCVCVCLRARARMSTYLLDDVLHTLVI
jgi:hypothetical protein